MVAFDAVADFFERSVACFVNGTFIIVAARGVCAVT